MLLIAFNQSLKGIYEAEPETQEAIINLPFGESSESSGLVFDSSAHLGARASRPLLMRTGTSALLGETSNDSL